MRKTVEHALEQGRRREEAFEARLKAVAEAAESRTKAVFDVLKDYYGPKFGDLDGKIDEYAERLGERLRDLEARAAAIETHFHRLLRLRGAARRLRPLFEDLQHLSERLLRAETCDYSNKEAWRADYEGWRVKLGEFWRLASRWDPPGIDPLALSADDLERVRGESDDERFADFESQRRRRVFVAAHLKHGQYAGEALARIAAEAFGEPNPA